MRFNIKILKHLYLISTLIDFNIKDLLLETPIFLMTPLQGCDSLAPFFLRMLTIFKEEWKQNFNLPLIGQCSFLMLKKRKLLVPCPSTKSILLCPRLLRRIHQQGSKFFLFQSGSDFTPRYLSLHLQRHNPRMSTKSLLEPTNKGLVMTRTPLVGFARSGFNMDGLIT